MKKTIESILAALNEASVRYLVVGGVAVVLHGYLRTTADLDLVIQLERGNVMRALEALEKAGYRPRLPVNPESFADIETRKEWIREKGMIVFPLYNDQNPLMSVDLFVEEPFDFDEVYQRALRVPLEQTTAPVVAMDDLITMKESAARPRDMEDVTALRKMREENEKHDG